LRLTDGRYRPGHQPIARRARGGIGVPT